MDRIYSINGPVVKVKASKSFSMTEMVYVGNKRLISEVINVSSDFTTIQVYEGTTGLMPGEPVVGTGAAMSALLGPGIITNIFDGIERPLRALADMTGAFIGDGAEGLFDLCESTIMTTVSGPMSLEKAMTDAPALYEYAAERLLRAIRIGTLLTK